MSSWICQLNYTILRSTSGHSGYTIVKSSSGYTIIGTTSGHSDHQPGNFHYENYINIYEKAFS